LFQDYSEEEVSKLKNDGFKYDGALLKNTCVRIYSEMVWAREVLAETVKKLKLWTTETNEASEEPELWSYHEARNKALLVG
jgi:hypothetical protein